MPYKFDFDLSRVSRSFFRELARIAHEKNLHRRIGRQARGLAKRFKVSEILGLDVSEAVVLIEDLVDIYIMNLSE